MTSHASTQGLKPGKSCSSALNAARKRKLDAWRIALGDALIALSFGLTDRPRLDRMPNSRGISRSIRAQGVYGALADKLDRTKEHCPQRTGFPFNPGIRRPNNWLPRKPASA